MRLWVYGLLFVSWCDKMSGRLVGAKTGKTG
jgi:hypothetical protein